MVQRILSISGLRGVVGDGLDPEYLSRFAAAVGTWAGGGRVVVARDGRATGPMIRDVVVAGRDRAALDADLRLCWNVTE